MSDQNSTSKPEISAASQPSVVRCLSGAAISSLVGYGSYNLMVAIATNFASKPLRSDNPITLNISTAVRTLVVGITALGTGIFAIVALGLLALATQLLFQQLTAKRES